MTKLRPSLGNWKDSASTDTVFVKLRVEHRLRGGFIIRYTVTKEHYVSACSADACLQLLDVDIPHRDTMGSIGGYCRKRIGPREGAFRN